MYVKGLYVLYYFLQTSILTDDRQINFTEIIKY